MPTYTFYNKKTEEEWTDMMSIASMEELLASDSDISVIPVSMQIGDPIRLGVTKPPSAFQKNVIGKIHEVNKKYSQIKNNAKFQIPREF